MPSQTPEQTPMKRERRMRAYYYGFSETGVDEVDDILEQIAIAGKMYHFTDGWTDEDSEGKSCVTNIQDAATKAAAEYAALRSRCESMEKALKDCQILSNKVYQMGDAEVRRALAEVYEATRSALSQAEVNI